MSINNKNMERQSYTNAVRLYVILDCLADREWHNIASLGREANVSNTDRLKKHLDILVQRNIIQHWETLSDKEKRIARKTQKNQIIRNNNYKITDKGLDKRNRIKNSCNDPKSILDIYEKDD